jgi:hypothetical protein
MAAIRILFKTDFPNCPELTINNKADLFNVANGERANCDFFMPLKKTETCPELIVSAHDFDSNDSDKENQWDSCDDKSDSDCEPNAKKQKFGDSKI